MQGILAARIDRLAEREKRVRQSAAVIGRGLDEPVLERVAGCSGAELAAALDALRRADFLHPTALYPVARFAFKHPLTQQVAYTDCLPRWAHRDTPRGWRGSWGYERPARAQAPCPTRGSVRARSHGCARRWSAAAHPNAMP